MSTHLDPPGIEWRRVSPRYVWAELVSNVIGWGAIAIGAFVLHYFVDETWTLLVAIASLVVLVLSTFFTARQVRAYGYQLRDDDLIVRRGIMFRRIVAVPYGRMQLVDINRGPVQRWLGLSELKFVTAAATSAVVIPGLPEPEAEQLRDRLVELAESRRAGL